MSRCVILSACPVSPELKRLLRPEDFIIACDAGYRNCEPLGCKPNIIVGDFDTAPCPAQEDDVIILPHVKDDTDTEYAAKLASEKGFPRYCCWGRWAANGWSTRCRTSAPALGWKSGASASPSRTSAAASPSSAPVRNAVTRKRNFSTFPSSPWRAGPRASAKAAPTTS